MRVTFRCNADYTCPDEEMLEKVTDIVIAMDTSVPHQNVVYETDAGTLRARLFFVDTPVSFKCSGGTLTISVDSTMTGPGYHACMVNMAFYLAETLNLEWDENRVEDLTGYWQHRDFKLLQAFMTDWLIKYSHDLTNAPNLVTPISTSLIMPLAMLPVGNEYFAYHSLGYMHKDFFIYIQVVAEPELFSRSFFIWWNMELDAEFYLKCALSVIWCRLNWLLPVLEEEMLDISNMLLELEIAWQMDKSLQFPVPEWLEIAKLTGDHDLAGELIRRFPTEINQPPSRGYRRHNIVHKLGDQKWAIRLPGKMHNSYDEDGSLIFWDHAERNIRITVSSRRDEEGNMLPSLELLSQSMEGLNVTPHLLPGYVNIPAFISHTEVQENNKNIYKTTLFAAYDGSMAVISIYYADRNEKQWAMSICNSLVPEAGKNKKS